MSKRLVYPDGTEAMQLFLYDGDNEIGSTDTSGTIRELRILGHTARAERSAVAFELHGKTYFPLPDLFGNVSCLLSSEGQVESYEYDAFGNENAPEDPISPWRYAAKRVDFESDLIYFGRRYYDPVVGIWLTPDPAGYTKGLNLYAYVCNDPLMSFDLYGLLSASEEMRCPHQLSRDVYNPGFYQGISYGFIDIVSGTVAGACYLGSVGHVPYDTLFNGFSDPIKGAVKTGFEELGYDMNTPEVIECRDRLSYATSLTITVCSVPSMVRGIPFLIFKARNLIQNINKLSKFGKPTFRLAGEQFSLDRKIGNFFNEYSQMQRLGTSANATSHLVPGGGLLAHESRGGHLIAKHVQKSKEYLIKRLNKIPIASSFYDLETAERAVSSALFSNTSKINKWLKSNDHILRIQHKCDINVGYFIKRGQKSFIDSNRLEVVLAKDVKNNLGYKILTGYVEP